MIIELDNTLKPITPKYKDSGVIERLAYVNKFKVEDVRFSSIGGDVSHPNYLSYLEKCWAYHRAPVLTPDILWYTLLCELTLIIRDNVKPLRRLFTDSQEKKEIIVVGDDPYNLPLTKIVSELKKLVPSDTELFLPLFSTSDDDTRLAQYAAFADAVSPYYSYGMLLCGFPYIKIEGTIEDYWLAYYKWQEIGKLFKIEKEYFLRVSEILFKICQNIKDGSVEFWKDMFHCKKCGSGGDIDINGWFSGLFRKQPDYPRKPCNFSQHVSKVDYKVIDINKEFTRYHGLFSSKDGGIELVPSFGWFCVEKVEHKSDQDAITFTTYTLKR